MCECGHTSFPFISQFIRLLSSHHPDDALTRTRAHSRISSFAHRRLLQSLLPKKYTISILRVIAVRETRARAFPTDACMDGVSCTGRTLGRASHCSDKRGLPLPHSRFLCNSRSTPICLPILPAPAILFFVFFSVSMFAEAPPRTLCRPLFYSLLIRNLCQREKAQRCFRCASN